MPNEPVIRAAGSSSSTVDNERAAAAPWLPAARRWTRRAPAVAHDTAQHLAAALGVPTLFCSLLIGRGYHGTERATAFLRPRMDCLRDPAGLAGMADAVARVEHAIRAGETVLVHGDYDVDGICSTTLLTRAFERCGARVVPFVPHRTRDGYDLGQAGVRAAIAAGAGLIVTADCGIGAHDAVAQAAAAGIDVVITDHHTPGDSLPDAVAVVNPSRADCRYGAPELAGAGVAFKLCQALTRGLGRSEEELWYDLDLVALATIADLAPLVGENRILTHFGLRVLRQTRKAGLRALLQVAGLPDAALHAGQVSHALGPRLNALGRLGAAQRGVRLLLTDDAAEAEHLARECEDENRRRQSLDRSTLGAALAMLNDQCHPERDMGLVLAAAGWHPGVIGIVATRVVEHVHRPVVLIALEDGTATVRGSGRSIPGINLYDVISRCAHMLDRFGGHRQAAGLEIRRERVPEFRAAFNAAVTEVIAADMLTPAVSYDEEAAIAALDAELLRLLERIGPYGIGNPTPVFAVRDARVVGAPRIVGDDHLRFTVEQAGHRLPVIGFRMAERCGGVVQRDARVDLALQLQEDRYRGVGALQGKLVDVRPACA